jgi:type VI secretion system secreted protein Hcp
MASDYLLELDGIKGESIDSKHRECIEIDSFSWGFTNAGSMGRGSGGGTGKVQFQDMHFTKTADKSTPLLVKAACTNQHIKKAVLYARKSSKGGPVDYYKVILTDSVVSGYQSGGNAGDSSVPHDSFSLNFTKFEVEYCPQKADGSLEGAITAAWDRSANA